MMDVDVTFPDGTINSSLVGSFVQTYVGRRYKVISIDSDGKMTVKEASMINEGAKYVLRKKYGHE